MTTRDEREGPAAGEPDVFLQHLTQGGELLAAGHTEEALGYLETALNLSPGDEKAQNLLGLCCFKLGHLDRAAEIYEHLVRENPVDPTLRVNLGLVYLKANATQRAVREFETATELSPDHRKAHNYLGLALAQAAEYGRAREHFLLAGSEHMAEKMGRALDGAGFEPVTTPAGGVAAIDPGHLSGDGMAADFGETPSPEYADPSGHPGLTEPMEGQGPTDAVTLHGDWGVENQWDGAAEPNWEGQGTWGEVGAEGEGWAHPQDGQAYGEGHSAEGWPQDAGASQQAYADPADGEGWSPEAGQQPYGQPGEGEGWSHDAGPQDPYGQAQSGEGWSHDAASQDAYGQAQAGEGRSPDAAAQDAYGQAQAGGGWSQDAVPQNPYGHAQAGEGWPQDAAEQDPYGQAQAGEGWPQDAGAALQPDAQAQAGEGWPQDAGPELQPYGAPFDGEGEVQDAAGEQAYGAPSEDAGWPQDAGAELQPGAKPGEDADWPSDAGAELQPAALQPADASDAVFTASSATASPTETGAAASDPEGAPEAPRSALSADADWAAQHDAPVDASELPAATSALDDPPEVETGSDPAEVASGTTPVTNEKVASLRPAKLEDSWGAQFGLEGEGTGATEAAEELVVELNASEVEEPEAGEDVSVDFGEAPLEATSAAPDARDAAAAKGTPAPIDRFSAAETPAHEAADGEGDADTSAWADRPGTPVGGTGWLVEHSRQLELRHGPSTEGVTELGDGVLDLQLRDGMRTRTHGYFALEGKVRLTPEPRRIRGRAAGQLFGPAGRELMRVQGSGHLLVRIPGRQLLALELGEEGLFLKEGAVYAFEENVMFENGSLSDPEGNEALRLVHLRGTGRILIELEGALRTVQIREGVPARIEHSRIVGWFGELSPRAVSAVTGLAAHVELSGQGFALIDAAHREATP